MSAIIKDFFQLGSLRLMTRFIRGLRGLFIIISLTPSLLGEYTIWLLYVFYFSSFELGVFRNLEKDLSHFRGQRDEEAYREAANTGWSSHFYLSLIASLGLAIVTFIVFRQWMLAVVLSGYLLAEKLYLAYDTNSRIFFKYKANGTAELIHVVIGFAFVYYCLPRYGIYSIFPCFMVSLIIGAVYLALFCRLDFQWSFQLKKIFDYIKKTLSLALMFGSIQVFNYIPMTIVAFIWDKATLGYYAFAFRIFQICFTIFPLLIREVMRTRMYFHMAEKEDQSPSFQDMIFPMSIYGLITSVVWLMFYWWTTFAVYQFAPEYKTSIVASNILMLSLLPLGISKISSDYLCSRVYNKMMFVNCCWIAGILFQIACIFLANYIFPDIFNVVPMIYVLGTIIVYISVAGYAFRIGGEIREWVRPMAYLLSPLVIACTLVLLIHYCFQGAPSLDITKNAYFSVTSIIGTLILSFWLIRSNKLHRAINIDGVVK